MSEVDYYETLGLGPEADIDEIWLTYQRVIAEIRRNDPGETERSQLVEEACAVLLDPVTRAEYDARCVGHDLIEETVAAILAELERRRSRR